MAEQEEYVVINNEDLSEEEVHERPQRQQMDQISDLIKENSKLNSKVRELDSKVEELEEMIKNMQITKKFAAGRKPEERKEKKKLENKESANTSPLFHSTYDPQNGRVGPGWSEGGQVYFSR